MPRVRTSTKKRAKTPPVDDGLPRLEPRPPSGPRPKLSVSIEPHVLSALDVRGEERSTILSRDLGRYYRLLAEARITLRERLTPGELGAILDVMNGHLWHERLLPGAIEIWPNVEDGCRLEGLHQKWSIDEAALVEKLKSLNTTEIHALTDAIERFWHAVGQGDQTRDPATALD